MRQSTVARCRLHSVPRWPLVVLLVTVLWPSLAFAQPDGQLWGTFTFDWAKSDRLTYRLELEPKVLVVIPEGEPGWVAIDVTPTVERGVKPWLDLVGEVGTAYTAQTDELDSFEVSPRAGLYFHLFSRDVRKIVNPRERPPKRRVVVRDLARVEWRNLFYNEGMPTSSTVRFRNRLEFVLPLNKENLAKDGVRYLTADWEWFFPLDDPAERFANKQRIRSGFGYRRNFSWRFEALYIWNRSRNTASSGFTTSDHIFDVRVKRVF